MTGTHWRPSALGLRFLNDVLLEFHAGNVENDRRIGIVNDLEQAGSGRFGAVIHRS